MTSKDAVAVRSYTDRRYVTPFAALPPLPCPDEHCRYWVCGDCSHQGFTRQHVGEYNGMCPNGHRNKAEPHTCRCGHHASAHSNIENGECLTGDCGCERLNEMLGCGYYDARG